MSLPVILGAEKKVVEYALPATVQTHEVVPAGDNMLVITQQERNGLIKVALDPNTGAPLEAIKFTLEDNPYGGAHGLFTSTAFPGKVWVTLQFESSIILVDPVADQTTASPIVSRKICLQPPLRGPHVVIEHDQSLWVTCKDSGHVAKVSFDGKEQKYWSCSRRPIFVAVTKHLAGTYVYASLDMSSKIFFLNLFLDTTFATEEIEIPAEKGSSPVGLVTGPDGYAWFVLLGGSQGGTGTFGRLIGKDVTWFQLNIAKSAGLLHLTFDTTVSSDSDMRLWLLGSSIGSMLNMDAVYTVHLVRDDPNDSKAVKIDKEDIITLPTQACLAHRVRQHMKGSFFVTELAVSALAHIKGNATEGPRRDDQAADAYALWGIGAYKNHVKYQA